MSPIADSSRRTTSLISVTHNPGSIMPLVVGVCGGIASGKSTVSQLLGELGARVIDADKLGHACYEPGHPCVSEMAAAFGPDGLLYAFGSFRHSGQLREAEAYDPRMDRWVDLPPLPVVVEFCAGAWVF